MELTQEHLSKIGKTIIFLGWIVMALIVIFSDKEGIQKKRCSKEYRGIITSKSINVKGMEGITIDNAYSIMVNHEIYQLAKVNDSLVKKANTNDCLLNNVLYKNCVSDCNEPKQ